jgi:hypothetical protein
VAHVRITDRSDCIVRIRHKATGNRLAIYRDHNAGRRAEIKWYRVFMVNGQRISHSTMVAKVAEGWIADALAPSDEFEALPTTI